MMIKVSIIIPAFNRVTLLGQALASCLSQAHRPLEVIVIDDGSTDSTQELLDLHTRKFIDLGIDFLFRKQLNKGAPAARNHGLSIATGGAIAFLDSDDVMHSCKIGYQVKALIEGPYDFVFSDRGRIRMSNSEYSPLNIPEPAQNLSTTCEDRRLVPAMISTGLARRSLFQNLGPWDESLSRHQDWEYSVRIIASNASCGYVPGVLYFQLAHDGERVNDQTRPSVDKPLRAIKSASSWLERNSVKIKHSKEARYRLGILACSALISAVKLRRPDMFGEILHIIDSTFDLGDTHRLKAYVLIGIYKACPGIATKLVA